MLERKRWLLRSGGPLIEPWLSALTVISYIEIRIAPERGHGEANINARGIHIETVISTNKYCLADVWQRAHGVKK